MSVSEKSMSDLAQKLGHYLYFGESRSHQIRHLPDFGVHYNVVAEAWAKRKLLAPPPNDPQKRQEFFDFIDEICRKELTKPEDHIEISFACWAATQVMIDQDLSAIPEKQRWEIMRRAFAYTAARRAEEPSDSEHIDQSVSHRVSSHEDAHSIPVAFLSASQLVKRDCELINEVIRYRDGSGEVKECIVVDHGTTQLKGEFFVIAHDIEGRSDCKEISIDELDALIDSGLNE
ncbi:hypothetical protein D9756_011220 [Leucocoprinus leucothites]|nr:hypothetical protein D9756_011220 [Leucoagaricus leucothites]